MISLPERAVRTVRVRNSWDLEDLQQTTRAIERIRQIITDTEALRTSRTKELHRFPAVDISAEQNDVEQKLFRVGADNGIYHGLLFLIGILCCRWSSSDRLKCCKMVAVATRSSKRYDDFVHNKQTLTIEKAEHVAEPTDLKSLINTPWLRAPCQPLLPPVNHHDNAVVSDAHAAACCCCMDQHVVSLLHLHFLTLSDKCEPSHDILFVEDGRITDRGCRTFCRVGGPRHRCNIPGFTAANGRIFSLSLWPPLG